MDLLELWQNIYQEVVQLAETVARLPDSCECGDADAHLEGRCRCCHGEEGAGEHRVSGDNCKTILARLRADLTMLSENFLSVASPMEMAALEKHRFELRRGVFLAANDLQQIVEAFKRVSESVAGFRATCAISEMRGVKSHCAELREHCDRVNEELMRK